MPKILHLTLCNLHFLLLVFPNISEIMRNLILITMNHAVSLDHSILWNYILNIRISGAHQTNMTIKYITKAVDTKHR